MIFYGTWIEELVASYALLPFHLAFYFIAQAVNKAFFLADNGKSDLGASRHCSEEHKPT